MCVNDYTVRESLLGLLDNSVPKGSDMEKLSFLVNLQSQVDELLKIYTIKSFSSGVNVDEIANSSHMPVEDVVYLLLGRE